MVESFVFIIMSADTTEMHTVTVVSLLFEGGKSGTNYVHKVFNIFVDISTFKVSSRNEMLWW